MKYLCFIVVSVDICFGIGLLRKLNIKLWSAPFNNLQLRGILVLVQYLSCVFLYSLTIQCKLWATISNCCSKHRVSSLWYIYRERTNIERKTRTHPTLYLIKCRCFLSACLVSLIARDTGYVLVLAIFKCTIQPDWICRRMVSMDRPLKGYQAL